MDDLVNRVFTARAPNRLWFSDITEHPTGVGKLYMCAVKDACSGRVVGYSISDRMTARIAVDAFIHPAGLPMNTSMIEVLRRPVESTQFRSRKVQRALDRYGLVGSMGRVGAAGDNAAMESFFALRQTTSWTNAAGRHETSCASRSSPGPDAPTTADADKPASDD